MDVSVLEHGHERAWDEFVHVTPGGTFFHLSGWRSVIETVLRHRTYYLVASGGGRMEGVLPLTHVKSRIFGNSLISNAFCVGGGPLAATSEARTGLIRAAEDLGNRLGVAVIEMRDGDPIGPGWLSRTGLHANFRRAIDPDPAVNLKAIPRKQRAVLRKAMAQGLSCTQNRDIDSLHKVYAESVHRLGTPVFSKRYFAALVHTFGEACDVVTVAQGGRPVASVLNFYFRDQVLPYYGGSTLAARTLGANDLLYWEVMQRAAARGLRVFDFGRSKIGTGAYAYKHNWGFEAEPLTYQFLPVRSATIPDINPLNPKYRIFIAGWQKLPLSLTKILGPVVVRSIG